jgi:two-component system, chemotaxis family, CheB/CheR fusion protein
MTMTASRTHDVNAALPRSSSHPDKMLERPHRFGPRAIVAIGASAGGLDACRAFLKALPAETGMSFVFVQHLDPTHHSLVVDLLKKHTTLTVSEAADGVLIERENLYVIPPGFYLAVEGGVLRVSRPKRGQRVRLPFDVLLTSLAKDAGQDAMAVVLSGTGADGSAGLDDIRKNGGAIIVQAPEDAAYDGMPRSAVLTGLADHIVPVDEIPKLLIDRAGTLAAERDLPKPTSMSTQVKAPTPVDSPSLVAKIIDLVRARTGHDFRFYKQGTLRRRIERRLGLAGLSIADFGAYLELLTQDQHELECLVKDLLINVTSFFRDKAIFELLSHKVIRDLIGSHSTDDPIRVWIAGCSSGEEAYSIAILFREAMAATNSTVRLQIFASDVDGDALAIAREGFYPETIASDVSKERLHRFFSKDEHGYRVLPELRSMVVFTEQDVLADPPFSRIDMVSCRNLLIYLGPEAQAKVISLFHFALKEGGILLLGSSETVGKSDGRFETISKSERLYRHAVRSRPGELMFSMSPTEATRTLSRPGSAPAVSQDAMLGNLVRQMVMDSFAPAAVLINKRHECLYSLGAINRYLTVAQGRPTLDIFAMLPKTLHTKLRSAIQRSGQQKKRVVSAGGELKIDGVLTKFMINVEPAVNDGQDLFLICFVDETGTRPLAKNSAVIPEDAGRILDLENELEVVRAELNGAIRNLEISGEEQKAINEEGASFNEEYQSANEELLTSKEELQSLNEELTALNGQLQETLERQRTTSNDLQNVLYSTEVATLFLDEDLNIRFFTPATKSLFKVIPGDIGRPLADLNSLAVDTTLLSDAALVLETHKAVEQEIESRSGAWYMRRILPYLGEDNGVEGVVITFVDVTQQRHTADAMQVARRQADLANAAKSRFLAAASHDLRQPLQTLSLLQGLLVRKVEDEKQQRLLARIGNTLGSMSGMLNALLDINQIEAGIVKAEIQDFRIQDLLVALRGEFRLDAQAKGLELRVVDCSLSVRTDPQLLEQMIRNLFSNALKYTRSGRILLGCRRRAGVLSIEIWDTGIGIPESELESIFDEYHQIDNEARERSKGLGLGLSIVQRLGKLLGHKVRVQSRQSKGSVFAIEAMVAKAVVAQPSRVETARHVEKHVASVGRSVSILVVEDDGEVRDLLDQLLTDEGHTVSTAPDGPAALALVGKMKLNPELILTDYNMPSGMTGMQLVKKLRSDFKRTIPAIVLTGDISSATLNDVAGKNIVRLAKPVRLIDVEHAIQKLLIASAGEISVQVEDEIRPGAANTVFVIDDDEDLLQALRLVLEKQGLPVETYISCEDFLNASHPRDQGCLIVDGYLPGMNGVDLLQRLKENGRHLQSIMMTGNSDVTMAVAAMKAGASDFIEKPINHSELLESVERALKQSRGETVKSAWHVDAAKRIASLTSRQQQIMKMVLAGHPSKNIAADLGISQRTVENHRACIMTKTGSKSLPALARLALAAEEPVASA